MRMCDKIKYGCLLNEFSSLLLCMYIIKIDDKKWNWYYTYNIQYTEQEHSENFWCDNFCVNNNLFCDLNKLRALTREKKTKQKQKLKLKCDITDLTLYQIYLNIYVEVTVFKIYLHSSRWIHFLFNCFDGFHCILVMLLLFTLEKKIESTFLVEMLSNWMCCHSLDSII